jgi:hypothetical protein
VFVSVFIFFFFSFSSLFPSLQFLVVLKLYLSMYSPEQRKKKPAERGKKNIWEKYSKNITISSPTFLMDREKIFYFLYLHVRWIILPAPTLHRRPSVVREGERARHPRVCSGAFAIVLASFGLPEKVWGWRRMRMISLSRLNLDSFCNFFHRPRRRRGEKCATLSCSRSSHTGNSFSPHDRKYMLEYGVLAARRA